jgi:hypothetical protein
MRTLRATEYFYSVPFPTFLEAPDSFFLLLQGGRNTRKGERSNGGVLPGVDMRGD